MVTYLELEPAPGLRPWVRCYWFLRRVGTAQATVEEATVEEPILPDGCVELVFHRGDRAHRRLDDGRLEAEPRALVVAELLRPIRLQPGKVLDCVAVRLEPGAARRFLPIPPRELVGELLDLSLIWPDASSTLDRLAALESPRAAASELDRLLTSHLRGRPADGRVDHLLAALCRSQGALPISTLAQQAGVSLRHLERLLTPALGLPPKRLARVLRFHHAFAALLDGNVDRALTAYNDHSHLLRDFRELALEPPRILLARSLELNRLFSAKSM